MTSNDLSFITLVAEQNVQWLERAADRASKELKDMDGQTNVDLLQFNGRELFRESIECAESFVWAFKGKRPYPAAAAARMILDRQMTWAAIVGADNPCKALQEQALNSEKKTMECVFQRAETASKYRSTSPCDGYDPRGGR